LPRWWAYFAVLIAIVLVIGPIGWAALIFGTPLWILGTTWLLLRPEQAPATRQEAAIA
jgi:type IV secretory pathway TrbD component